MAIPTYHCVECEQDFKAPNWVCVTGGNHVVAEKRYYTADAPTVPDWINGFPHINYGAARTQVLNIPPERKVEEAGEIQRIPGGMIEFVRGLYATTNPEIQFYLDKKEGLCSYERWKEVYWSDKEKMEAQRMEMEAQQHRLQQDHNELLAKVKAMQAESKPERKKPGPKPKMLEGQPA